MRRQFIQYAKINLTQQKYPNHKQITEIPVIFVPKLQIQSYARYNLRCHFSPFRSFTRDEWSKLEEHPMFPVSDIDLSKLQALNEPLTMEEVEKIYIPMVRLLQIHISHYRNLHNSGMNFLRTSVNVYPILLV